MAYRQTFVIFLHDFSFIYLTEWSAIWCETIHVISKSREFNLKSQLGFLTKIASQEVQFSILKPHVFFFGKINIC